MAPDPVTVSVIIPVYLPFASRRLSAFLREAIDSVLRQSYQPLEVIVVDDGSADDLRWVQQTYGERVRYIRQANGGQASARNTGIRRSCGECLAFLDADDVWEPDKVTAQLEAFRRCPRAGLVYSPVTKIDEAGQPVDGPRRCGAPPAGAVLTALFMRNFIPTSTVMARRACVESVGLFDESPWLVSAEDYDLWLRVAARYEIACVDRPLARYRVHADGVSRNPERSYLGEQRVIERAVARFGERHPQFRALLRRRLGRLFFEYGYEYFAREEFRAARQRFLRSLRWTPWRLRVWGYWCSTLFGGCAVAALRRLKRTRHAPSMVRVLHVLNTLDTGGAERVVLNLATRIDRGRFTLLVCSLGDAGDLAEEFRRLGVPVFAMHRRAGIDPSLWIRLARLCRREQIGVLHTHNATPWLYGGLAARLAGAALCHTEHSNLFPRQRALRVAERILARLTRVVFAVSDTVRRQLVERQGLPAGKVVTVVNGIEANAAEACLDVRAARAALGLNGAQQVIGTVGRLAPVKDHGTLLAAFQRVLARFPATRLVVVGDGPERERLARRAAELGIAERVTWLGQRRDVRELLPVFDVFVLSSVSEGMPLTVLEAMAAGKPVVATDVGGVGEAVVNGETGLLVPASSPERLADAVAALLADRTMRHAFGDRARQRAKERFDVSGMVQRYEAAYHH